MAKTLYDVLEVSQDASPETITSTYRRLHGKLMEGVSSTFADEDTLDRLTALREAHHVLSDPGRRRRYDLRLSTRQGQALTAGHRTRTFLMSLIAVTLIGAFGIGYAKYQTEPENAPMESNHVAGGAEAAKLKAHSERQDKPAGGPRYSPTGSLLPSIPNS